MLIKRLSLFCILLMLAAVAVPGAEAMSVSFDDFSDLSPFTLNGSAASINSSGPVYSGGQDVLRLTNNYWQGSSAFLSNPFVQDYNASFSTMFSFQITNSSGSGGGADGLVFVIQTVANNVGGYGGSIGYGGISPSVGIEFDTYNNGPPDGYNGNHIGINLNGSTSSIVRAPYSQSFKDGSIYYVWVDYNGPVDLLQVRLSDTPERPSSWNAALLVDLKGILGTSQAYVGFTSGTGAGMGNHDIRSWYFTSTYDPIESPGSSVPEPVTLVTMLTGIAGGLAFRKKRGLF